MYVGKCTSSDHSAVRLVHSAASHKQLHIKRILSCLRLTRAAFRCTLWYATAHGTIVSREMREIGNSIKKTKKVVKAKKKLKNKKWKLHTYSYNGNSNISNK